MTFLKFFWRKILLFTGFEWTLLTVTSVNIVEVAKGASLKTSEFVLEWEEDNCRSWSFVFDEGRGCCTCNNICFGSKTTKHIFCFDDYFLRKRYNVFWFGRRNTGKPLFHFSIVRISVAWFFHNLYSCKYIFSVDCFIFHLIIHTCALLSLFFISLPILPSTIIKLNRRLPNLFNSRLVWMIRHILSPAKREN